MTPIPLGPENATLRVLTKRQGVAAKVGHDLVIEVASWSATLTPGSEPTFELEADGGSMQIVDGSGGAKPLTDGDRQKIKKNIDDDILRGGKIRFQTTGAGQGDLEINGTTHPAPFDLHLHDDGTVHGSARIKQTEWGIKPYSGLMGALKVADEIEIAVEGRLP